MGSKYHDFIQSADHIATMHSNIKEMKGHLENFQKKSKDVVFGTKDLLTKATPSIGSKDVASIKSNHTIA